MKPVRNRSAFASRPIVVLRCGRCPKRLAELDLDATVRQDVDGAWYVKPQRAAKIDGLEDIANEDWLRVVCPKCGADWRGRRRDLAAIVERAQSLGLDSAKLGAPATVTR